MHKVFISFSFNDDEFAIELSRLIKKVCKNEEIVYCVAENNNYNSVKYGEDFSEDFLNNVKECEIFIPLLSVNYLASISSIIELGAALGTEKTILPLLLPDTDYHVLNKVYNLRNRDFYSIDDKIKFKKFIGIIRETFQIVDYEEDVLTNFKNKIDDLKKNYLSNIALQNKCELFFNDNICKSKGKEFETSIIDEKLVETIVCEREKGYVKKYHLYMGPNKTVSDLKHFLEKNNFKNFDIKKLD